MLPPRPQCSSTYQVNFTYTTTMLSTKTDDLTLALQKAMEGFTAIVDRPTDNNIINIRQWILPVLMKTKYDEITLTHNLSGVILPTERYKHIYLNRAYLILPVIALYNNTIDKDATITEVHQAEVKNESKQNDRVRYETADTSCKNFIM